MNLDDSNANQQPVIKSEVDESPTEPMLWEDSSENLRRPIKREEDEVLHPSAPLEPAECYAIKTEEVHIYSVLPEEEIHEPLEPPSIRSTSKRKDKSEQSGEFPCSTCEVKCPSEARLKQHEFEVHQVEIAHHPCLECGKMFFTEQELGTHTCQPEKEGSTFAERNSSIKNVLKCYICTTTMHFMDVKTLDHHLESFHPHKVLYQCQECNALDLTIHMHNRHLSKHDPELRPFKCEICTSRFSTKSCLRQHEASIHQVNNGMPNRRYCSKCKKTIYITKWDEHVCSRVDIIHICLICDLEFSTKRSLNKHVTSVHETAPGDVEAKQIFRCYLCEPATDKEDEKSLQEHLSALHPPQDVNHCVECDIYFRKVSTYNQHLQRHDASLRPLKCSHCPLRFSRHGRMRQHEADIHQVSNGRTKRRVIQRRSCRICKKQVNIDQLEEHMQTKHLTSPHVSSTCGMDSTYEKKQKQDVPSVHDSSMFECYLCISKNVFDKKELLQEHLEEAHPSQSGYQCRKCNYSTSIVSCFNDHLVEHDDITGAVEQTNPQMKNKHVTNADDTAPVSMDVEDNPFFKCYLCKPVIRMQDKKLLQEHLLASHMLQDVFCCAECDRYFGKVTTLNQHLQRHDASVRPFKCSQCSLRFKTNAVMLQHEVEIHQVNNGRKKKRIQKARYCRICKKTIFWDTFEKHMQREHPTSPHASWKYGMESTYEKKQK